MSILSSLLADIGLDSSAPRNTVAGQILAREGVHAGPEHLRIRSLPRRRWQDDPTLEELVTRMTAWLKTPGGTERLFVMQAVALRELHDCRKLNVVANMGLGKTLVSALAPVVLESKRPLFITYAQLIDKTIREFRKLAEHWKVARNYEFLNAEKIVQRKTDFLAKYQPDCIVIDESHLAKGNSGRRRRLGAYLREENPSCVFVPLTGTPGDKVEHISHIQHWVHGDDQSPVPYTYQEAVQWGQALDPEVKVRRAWGVLADFCDTPPSTLDDVRRAVGRRIEETPGNIYARSSGSVASSLYLTAEIFNGYPEHVEAKFEHVRKFEDETPDGRVLETGAERHLLLQAMSLGFWHLLTPPPPKPWREARKLYNAFVRDVLSQKKYNLFMPFQVERLLQLGEIKSFGVWETWKEIQGSYKPDPKIEWFDDSALKFCADWLAERKGCVWVPYPAFGLKLAALTGLPFFHRLGISATHGSIEAYPGGTGAILSTQANTHGRNLQDRWSECLILCGGNRSAKLEQMIARFHRTGQKADSVGAAFFVGTIEALEQCYRARASAEHDRDFNKNESSKLLTGDWLVPSLEEVEKWNGPRWEK